MPLRIVVTCEHAGNRIPARYKPFFRGREDVLATHRGYDAGALAVARSLARALSAPLFAAATSRLLIDFNRSLGHPGLFSEAVRAAPAALRREIVARYYLPYRQAAEGEMAQAIERGGRIVHISCHSFVPELGGVVRNADVGLLYDPARAGEARLCRRLQQTLGECAPQLKVRRNYPYRGKDDGFTASLRQRFPARRYVGVEIEVNQKHVDAGGRAGRFVREALAEALRKTLGLG